MFYTYKILFFSLEFVSFSHFACVRCVRRSIVEIMLYIVSAPVTCTGKNNCARGRPLSVFSRSDYGM